MVEAEGSEQSEDSALRDNVRAAFVCGRELAAFERQLFKQTKSECPRKQLPPSIGRLDAYCVSDEEAGNQVNISDCSNIHNRARRHRLTHHSGTARGNGHTRHINAVIETGATVHKDGFVSEKE